MPGSSFDVIIIGLGAMGSAASCRLAIAGQKVLGLDRYTPPHAFGSSHGRTRIIREAYFEHPVYVPLVQRAYELWTELEGRAGRRLFTRTGGLMIGPQHGVVFGGAKRSAEEHRLPHELLSASEVHDRFSALTPPQHARAVWEPRAGILFPEACIEAQLQLARRGGALLHFGEAVQNWEPDGSGVRVVTEKRSYTAGQLLLCAGPWTRDVLAGLGLPLQVERQVQFWFEPLRNARLFQPEHCPIYICEFEAGRYFYGFPDLGEGVKVAGHHEGATTHPDTLDRDIKDPEVERMREILRRVVPDANGALRSALVCMYTNTPDGHFLIDRHPGFSQVLIASPCSGHGFKFSSAIGEVLADLLMKGTSAFDLGLFSVKRFGNSH